MTFDDFLESAWDDHADRPQEVAGRLAASLHIVESPEHIAPFARLVTHVYGEHLGRWSEGLGMLDAVRALPAYAHATDAAANVDRNAATLRYAAGDHGVLASLVRDDQVAVLAAASSAFVGRDDFRQAIAAYAQALELAATGLVAKSPAIRALAVGGNNLAVALEQKRGRDGVETQAMLRAAQSALEYWTLAGTWLETERAECRLARSQLEARDAVAAVQSASRCLAICERNAAPAFERFCAHAILALAQRAAGDGNASEGSRAQALSQFDALPQDERRWCKGDLDELAQVSPDVSR
ncbi:MAG: hypothetical protein ABI881_00695 [Betaproteobacteria bacterium]